MASLHNAPVWLKELTFCLPDNKFGGKTLLQECGDLLAPSI